MSEVTVVARELVRALEQVLPLTATDMVLPTLVAVHLEVDDGFLYVSATDRFVMGVARCEVFDDDGQVCEFLLSRKDAQRIVTAFKGGPVDWLADLFIQDDGKLRVSDSATDIVAAEVEHDRWVQPRKVAAEAQQRPTEPTPACFNPAFLARFKHISAHHLRISVKGPHQPMVIEAPDFVGLLMPIRRDEPTGFEVFTGCEVGVSFTPTRDFERRIAKEAAS